MRLCRVEEMGNVFLVTSQTSMQRPIIWPNLIHNLVKVAITPPVGMGSPSGTARFPVEEMASVITAISKIFKRLPTM
jgi:hypothetical protein